LEECLDRLEDDVLSHFDCLHRFHPEAGHLRALRVLEGEDRKGLILLLLLALLPHVLDVVYRDDGLLQLFEVVLVFKY